MGAYQSTNNHSLHSREPRREPKTTLTWLSPDKQTALMEHKIHQPLDSGTVQGRM